MFERLDKLRADVERCRQRVEQSRVKLKEAEDKLKAAEQMQILSDVKSMNFSPEQLNALFALVAKKNANAILDGIPAMPGDPSVILSEAMDPDETTGAEEAPAYNEMEDNEDE